MTYNQLGFQTLNGIHITTKEEQRLAIEAYDAFTAATQGLKSEYPEIEIEGTTDQIKVPKRALTLLEEILKAMSQGKPISLVTMATEVTTQKGAEILGYSRPHLVKLLETGEIEYTKVGKHRRIKYEDIMAYRKEVKERQKKHLVEIMKSDEELELYDA